jgi:hypothetical protein
LRDQSVPLVFLDARPASNADNVLESIASELLQVGVASIVTTRQSGLPDAARRFVGAFYRTLSAGARIGDAVLEGQRQLKDDAFRGRVLGAGDARIKDWFNPVLYQEKDDLQLVRSTPSRQTEADIRAALTTRLGGLPESPQCGFVGRSRGLLELERLLQRETYAVIRGPIGAGKTTLAVEFARWMVRSGRFARAAFVTLEPHTSPKAILVAIANQVIGSGVVPDTVDDIEQPLKEVERALLERSTLLLLDDVEGLLPPAGMASLDGTAEQAATEFAIVAALCRRIAIVGQTRIIFVSREELPNPFDTDVNQHVR